MADQRQLTIRSVIVAALITWSVLFLWWLPAFTQGFLPFDEWAYMLPWSDWMTDRDYLVHENIVPEWNPRLVMGVNYIGRDPFNNPLSLGNLFAGLFADPRTEWLFATFFFLTIFSLGTFCHLRSLGISVFFSTLGAALIVIYPKWQDEMYHGPGKFIAAYCMVPWIALLLPDLFRRGPRLSVFVLFGFIFACMFLGSGAWVTILCGYLLVPYFLYLAMTTRAADGRRNPRAIAGVSLGFGLSGLLALGLSAYLLLPLWDNLHLIERSLFGPPSGRGFFDYLGIILPLKSRLYTMGYYDIPLNLPITGPIDNARFYFGIWAIPLTLFVLSVPDLRKRFLFFAAWPIIVGFLYSKFANSYFPLISLFEQAIGAQTGENHFSFAMIICINVVSMGGLSDLFENADRGLAWKDALKSRWTWATLRVFYALYIAIIATWLFLGIFVRVGDTLLNHLLAHSVFTNPKYFLGLQITAYTFFFDRFFLLYALSFASRIGILGLLVHHNIPSLRRRWILALMMCLDLLIIPSLFYPMNGSSKLRWSHDTDQNSWIESHVAPSDRTAGSHFALKTIDLTRRIEAHVKERWQDNWKWNPPALAEDFAAFLPNGGYYAPLFDPQMTAFPVVAGAGSYNCHSSFFPDYFFDFDEAMNHGHPVYVRQSWNGVWDASSRLLDFAGIKWLFWHAPLNDSRLELVHRYPLGNGFIYKNGRAVPKAYLVRRLEISENRESNLGRMQEDSFDPSTMAISEDTRLVDVLSSSDTYADTVSIKKYGANRIELEVSAGDTALLVIPDLFFPYWTATIDGAKAPIYRVNTIFRGIVLSKGDHRVFLKYENPWLRKGVKITIFTLAIAIVLGFVGTLPSRIPHENH